MTTKTTIVLWSLYLAAQAIHIFWKGYYVIRSSNSGVKSYRQYLSVNFAPLLVRVIFCTAVFVWWFDDPLLVDKIFDKAGNQLAPGFLHDLIVAVHFPLNAGTAMIYGLSSDSVGDKMISLIPWMRKDVPPGGQP